MQIDQKILRKLPRTLAGFLRKHLAASIEGGLAARNLFRCVKNKETGCWKDPIYSLRRQAVLRKEAERYGLSEWLPPRKDSKRAPMSGISRWKGTLGERTRTQRAARLQKALEEQPQKIAAWKASVDISIGKEKKIKRKRYFYFVRGDADRLRKREDCWHLKCPLIVWEKLFIYIESFSMDISKKSLDNNENLCINGTFSSGMALDGNCENIMLDEPPPLPLSYPPPLPKEGMALCLDGPKQLSSSIEGLSGEIFPHSATEKHDGFNRIADHSAATASARAPGPAVGAVSGNTAVLKAEKKEPLSIEELVKKKKEAAAMNRPKFLTREQREAIALEKRRLEVEKRRQIEKNNIDMAKKRSLEDPENAFHAKTKGNKAIPTEPKAMRKEQDALAKRTAELFKSSPKNQEPKSGMTPEEKEIDDIRVAILAFEKTLMSLEKISGHQ
ncbi:hypothetical protein PMAC_000290 [Pneumocystis sp. 'macacae']|nr:hypothetical protein PMAC_000290 [Pneumocystis sp. 'macacae']